jgi:hypothetical protein
MKPFRRTVLARCLKLVLCESLLIGRIRLALNIEIVLDQHWSRPNLATLCLGARQLTPKFGAEGGSRPRRISWFSATARWGLNER